MEPRLTVKEKPSTVFGGGSMRLFPLIALVAPTGGGKSRLLKEIHEQHPGLFGFVKSYSTRPWRTEGLDAVTDPLMYHPPLSARVVEAGLQCGHFFYAVQFGSTNGIPNLYANSDENIQGVLKEKPGVIALVEPSVITIQNHVFHYMDKDEQVKEGKYDVWPVKIVPLNQPEITRNDPARARDDAEREKTALEYRAHVVNDFSPGGLAVAVQSLATILQLADASRYKH